MKEHIITADWLTAKTDYDNPRVMIKRKYVWLWDKSERKLKKNLFLGRLQNIFAFKIMCSGKECGWSHLEGS